MCDFSELNQMIRENQEKLLHYAQRYLGNPESAQDAVQDAMLRYIRYVRQEDSKPIENLSAWLYRTTRNICLDVLRSARYRLETTLSEEEEGHVFTVFASPETEIAREDDVQMAKVLIEECLTSKEREILSLKFESGKSYREIAEICGIAPSYVGVILHGAVKKLQGEFQKRGNPAVEVGSNEMR